MTNLKLRGQNILVTAGSTWIKIDSVRVITNIFKGKIGLTIAKLAADMGANVTLLLGSSLDISNYTPPANLRIVRFRYFDELDNLITRELKEKKFDAVIHSAAVSDFKLSKEYDGKISSSNKKIILELIPTKKIVDGIKKITPSTFLVKFKLEVGITVDDLLSIALKSLKKSNADLIVANIYNQSFSEHEAYILNSRGFSEKVTGKENIALHVLNHIYGKE